MRNTRTTHYTSPAAETMPLSPNYWGIGRLGEAEYVTKNGRCGTIILVSLGKLWAGRGKGSSVLVKAVSFAFKGCYCCCLVVFFPEMM